MLIDKPGLFVFTNPEPLGGVALEAGNTVVLKASEHASAAMLYFGRLVEEVGFRPAASISSQGMAIRAAKR